MVADCVSLCFLNSEAEGDGSLFELGCGLGYARQKRVQCQRRTAVQSSFVALVL